MKKLFPLIIICLIWSTPSNAFSCANVDESLPSYSVSDFLDENGVPLWGQVSIDLLNCITSNFENTGNQKYNVDMMIYGSSELTVSEIANFLGNEHADKGLEITSPDATDLGTAITLLNEIKGVLNAMNGF